MSGRNTARIMQEAGAKVIAVSDQTGGLYNPHGPVAELLVRYQCEGFSLRETKLGVGLPTRNY